jgi:hypothetical protein
MKTKHLVIVIVLLLVIAGGGVGIYKFTAKPKDASNKKADFELSANELVSAFEQDENAANAKYIDKVIIVEGKVMEISKENILLGEEPSVINCGMSDNAPYSDVAVDDHLKIKGVCTGYDMLFGVGLTKCVVIE